MRNPYEKSDAIEILRSIGVRPDDNFFALSQDQVSRLLVEADRFKYRQPKNANGSRARYFHARLVRQATRKDST